MANKNKFLEMIEPSKKLKTSIMNKIEKEEMKMAMYRIVFGSIASLASISVAVIFVTNIIRDAYQSGLSQYLSLIFSDGSSLVNYWQTYMMSVVESLPIIGITMAFISVLIFVWSINYAIENFKNTKLVFNRINI
jgi:hypothetical protein